MYYLLLHSDFDGDEFSILKNTSFSGNFENLCTSLHKEYLVYKDNIYNTKPSLYPLEELEWIQKELGKSGFESTTEEDIPEYWV